MVQQLNGGLTSYEDFVILTLLYACETWVMYHRNICKLEQFHQMKLCQIRQITWQGRITNNEVLLHIKMERFVLIFDGPDTNKQYIYKLKKIQIQIIWNQRIND